MATQLALQRNFVTITPTNQISTTTVPSNQTTTTLTTATTNGDIVTITGASNQASPTETNNTPIHIMQTHTQVKIFIFTFFSQKKTVFLAMAIATFSGFFIFFVSFKFLFKKKYILQAGTTSDGVSIIDVVPIDQSDSPDEAPITVSTILPSNSVASSPNSSNSQQITAQVAFVQTQESGEISETKPHFITVNGK